MELRKRCWQLVFAALAIRLLWLALLLLSNHRRVGSSDSLFYDQVAWNLVRGRGYTFEGMPTAFHPPGYPLLLAAVYAVAGRSQGAAQFVGILLSSLSCVLTVKAARELKLSPRVAVIAGALMAVYPSQVFYSTFIGSEALCTVLLLGAFIASLRRRYLAASVLLGAAALTRAIALLFVPLLIVWMARDRLDLTRWRRCGLAVVILIGALGPLVPWAMRNEKALGTPVATTTSDGYALWAGNSPGAHGAFRSLTAEVGRSLPDDEAKKDAKLRRLAIKYAIHHPVTVAALVPAKLFFLFVPDISGLSFNRYENPSFTMSVLRWPLTVAAEVINAFVIAAAFFGVIRLRKSNPKAALWLFVPTLVFIVGVVATHAENRYRIPFAWLFTMAAASEISVRARRNLDTG